MDDSYELVYLDGKPLVLFCGESTGWSQISVEMTESQAAAISSFLNAQIHEKAAFLESLLGNENPMQ